MAAQESSLTDDASMVILVGSSSSGSCKRKENAMEEVDRYRLRRRAIGLLLAGSASALFTALLLLLYEWRLM